MCVLQGDVAILHVVTLPSPGSSCSALFATRGSLLHIYEDDEDAAIPVALVGCWDGLTRLIRMDTGRILHHIRWHTTTVCSVAAWSAPPASVTEKSTDSLLRDGMGSETSVQPVFSVFSDLTCGPPVPSCMFATADKQAVIALHALHS